MVFKAYLIEDDASEQREQLKQRLRSSQQPMLMLDTCQRLEVYTFAEEASLPTTARERHEAQSAFERLTRIAAGLESRILGELEVLGQVRNAYCRFKEDFGTTDVQLDRILQEVIALARKARKESGIDSQMTSLSGLTARTVLEKIEPGSPIAVIGSGQLAASIIRYLGKRGNSPIRVSSRCPEKAMSLAMLADGFGAGLTDLAHLLDGAGGIITATAAPHPVLFPHHLDLNHAGPIVVADLGVPSDCSLCVKNHKNVEYIGLESIEKKALVNLEDRISRSEHAASVIRQGAQSWTLAQ